jgi:glucose/mannose transport system substrate-binding protein
MVHAHREPLARYLLRLGVASGDVDDAVQEVFVVAANKLESIREDAERAFLFASALRVAGNARRGQNRRNRAASRFLLEMQDHPHAHLEEMTDQLRARSLLEEAIDDLPPEARLVFRMSEIQEMPVPAIAEQLGIPEGTVASRLRRARAFVHERTARTTVAALENGHSRPRLGEPAELLSWWVSGGEVDALRALVGLYRRAHPNSGVIDATASGALYAKSVLRSRMLEGRPPDTFQVNGGSDLFSWVRRRGIRELMDPLDFLYASEGWNDAFPTDVLDLVRYDGRTYAVPIDIHRTNTLFYNKKLFDRLKLDLPSSFGDLFKVASVLEGNGITPFAIGSKQPWTLSMIAFENVMIAIAGGEYYRRFFSGQCRVGDIELRETLHWVGKILDRSNEDRATLGWQAAADMLGDGRAGMMIMGDWAKGYLASKGFAHGSDYGQIPTPGTNAFVFATDTFGLPRNAMHPGMAIDLLKIFGSKSGQDAFNVLKGSIPARADVDLSHYDPFARHASRDFWTTPRHPCVSSIASSAFVDALHRSMGEFARHRDEKKAVSAIGEHYEPALGTRVS